MKGFLEQLFPQGWRKLVFSLIALILGFVLDRYGKLDDNMKNSLIAITAIFVTGNVGEHLAGALKFLKGTKLGDVVEDIIPGDQGLRAGSAQPAMSGAVEEAHDRIDATQSRIADIEQKLAVQAANTKQIVDILNAMRNASATQQNR